MFNHSKRIIGLILIFGVIVNIFISHNNLKKYDQYRERSDGLLEHYMIRSDILNGWRTADKIRDKLKNDKNFFESLPANDRWFLPCVFIGIYFYILDQEIFDDVEINQNEKKIKKKNNKITFLIFQIIIFYLSLYYLSNKLKGYFNQKNIILLILILSFEPTLFQWHTSFWSESIYLSFLILLLGKLINLKDKLTKNIFVGLLLGIMFAQRSASFLLILPILLYYLFFFQKNVRPYLVLIASYFFILGGIGINNYFKTDKFFILPYHSQMYSNYHYMLHEMKAKSEKKSIEETLKEKIEKESKWQEINKIDKDNFNDIFLIINYRHKQFLAEVVENPLNSFFYLLKKISHAAILDPFWVKKNLFLDKSEKDYNLKLNNDILIRILYSLIFYSLCFLGLCYAIRDFLKKKHSFKYNNFLILNILMIVYFFVWTGGYGVSRYFVPTIINFSFFFIIGLNYLLKKK
tara:strand:+ start:375 stop:1763 length:1389 start_codon:yes stop_codon:yes gene_type:complete